MTHPDELVFEDAQFCVETIDPEAWVTVTGRVKKTVKCTICGATKTFAASKSHKDQLCEHLYFSYQLTSEQAPPPPPPEPPKGPPRG